MDTSIAILFPTNNLVEGFAKGLREAGIPVETRKSGLDFSNAVPKTLTIYSAKGLTFESVLMPRLVRRSFPAKLGKWANRLLYVGVTRATKWLYLSGTQGSTIAELDRVRRLADEAPPVITVQRERPAQSGPARAGGSDEEIFDIF